MKQRILTGVLAIGLWFAAQPVLAASLGLTTDTPRIVASDALVEFSDLGFGFGDLSSFGAVVDSTEGIALTDPAEISFGFGFDSFDPTDLPAGGFSIFDDFGFNEVLSGDLVALGFMTDTIELLMNVTGGSAVGSFGPQVLLTISFNGLGADPFAAFVDDGQTFAASLTVENVVDSNVIPLPAGLPLLLTALGGLVVVRRRRVA